MDRKCVVFLIQFVSIYQKHSQETPLPKYVFRVNNCPDPYNSSEWTRASTRLNCLDSLNSDEIGNVYHCLASVFLNETVEFCGRSIYVTAGYCPVYNYTYEEIGVPDVYNCDTFIYGCPTQMFYSKNVRKYPSCINVNTEFGCFHEERNCPKESKNPEISNTIKAETEASSAMLKISTSTSSANATIYLYIDIIFIIAVLSCVIMLEIYLIYRYIYIRKTKSNPEFSAFLKWIGNCINEDTWHSMRTIVLGIIDHNCFEQETGTRILFKMSELLKLEYNMTFLEWIFDKCKERDLVIKCQQFSADNQFQLKCFDTKVTPRTGNQQLQFKIKMSEKESITSEVQDLRFYIAKKAYVHPGEILITALNIEPEQFMMTFLMKDRHANTFLKYVKTNAARKSLNDPNLNGKLKIAILIHLQKEIKLHYTEVVQSDPEDNGLRLSEPNLSSNLRKASSKCLRKKIRQNYARNARCNPKDNEATILHLNQTRNKRRSRRWREKKRRKSNGSIS